MMLATCALNSPNETDRKARARSTGLEPQRGARWDGLSPYLPLPLRCLRLPRRRRLRGFASRPGSAPADTPAPTTSSTLSFSRCGDASAAARCRSAHLCGAAPVADEQRCFSIEGWTRESPAPMPGFFFWYGKHIRPQLLNLCAHRIVWMVVTKITSSMLRAGRSAVDVDFSLLVTTRIARQLTDMPRRARPPWPRS